MGRKAFFTQYWPYIQRLGIGSVIFGAIAALTKVWVEHWLGPAAFVRETPVEIRMVSAAVPSMATSPLPESTPGTVEALISNSPITLAEWQTRVERKYESAAQRERQFREFLGKEMTWEGYFDQLNPLPDHVEGAPGFVLIMHESYAALHSDAPLPPPSVRCFCSAETGKKLARAKRGEWIVIKGLLSNPLLTGTVLCTDLTQCELIAHSPVRNVNIAAESLTQQMR